MTRRLNGYVRFQLGYMSYNWPAGLPSLLRLKTSTSAATRIDGFRLARKLP